MDQYSVSARGRRSARPHIQCWKFPTTSNNFGNSYRLSLLAGPVSAAIYTSNEQETTISVSGLQRQTSETC